LFSQATANRPDVQTALQQPSPAGRAVATIIDSPIINNLDEAERSFGYFQME
jgi:hypothetical protein